MRKISKTLAIMGLLAPMGANALGVGEIELHSALNQNLEAEIPLITSSTEKLSDIRVKLASPSAFAKAGIERHFFLSSLRFEPIAKADGRIVVRVSSRNAVREPYLNFLLEVNWPEGHMLREFTLLLDPPSTFSQKTLTAQQLPATGKGWTTVSPVPVRGEITDGEYGPTIKNDTLWDIAELVNRDPGVSHEQMMMALFKTNPEAFYQKNVNALGVGKRLQVPDKQVITQISKQQARAEFYRQNAIWNSQKTAGSESLASGTPVSTPTAADAVEPERSETGIEKPLKLLVPSEQAMVEAKPNASAAATGRDSEIAAEVVETLRQENDELRQRLAELEQQLVTTQKLLNLQTEQLAVLQTQAPQPADAKAKVLNLDGGKKTLDPESEKSLVPPKPEQKPLEAKVTKPAKSPEPAAEPGIFSEPYTIAAGGLGALVLGLGTWIALRRRKAKLDESDSLLEPVVQERSIREEQPMVPLVGSDTGSDTEVIAESSFLSEFTPSDFDAIDAEQDEIDPVSEADVYLAYGRYQQAEELIRSAIETNPEREECKLKLLEIFYAAENQSAFETYAEQLHGDDRLSSDFWDKVVEMGRVICPESGLFAGDPGGSAISSGPMVAGPVDMVNLEDDSVFEQDRFLLSEEEAASGLDEDLGLELDEGIDGTEHEEIELSEPLADARDDEQSLDFDLSFQEAEAASRGSDEESAGSHAPDEAMADSNLLDFDVSSHDDNENHPSEYSGKPLAETEAAGKDIDAPDHALDFDLDLVLSDEMDDDLQDEEDSALTDMDEIETKLDLAKAYVDMDDEIAALDMLNEIIDLGNPEQKQEARALAQRLGRSD